MKKSIRTLLACAASITLITGCNNEIPSESNNNEVIYFGGDIITMKGDEPNYVEALVTKDDSIIFTGTLAESKSLFGGAKETNLKGNTMLPGFIDAHAHFAGFPSQSIGAQILPPPDAGANNMESLIQILKDWSTPENIELTGWIFGMG
ncbi:MAG: amidohydrolase family protein, partial [Vicingaceae bacterium]